jgi:hypothetical protein
MKLAHIEFLVVARGHNRDELSDHPTPLENVQGALGTAMRKNSNRLGDEVWHSNLFDYWLCKQCYKVGRRLRQRLLFVAAGNH